MNIDFSHKGRFLICLEKATYTLTNRSTQIIMWCYMNTPLSLTVNCRNAIVFLTMVHDKHSMYQQRKWYQNTTVMIHWCHISPPFFNDKLNINKYSIERVYSISKCLVSIKDYEWLMRTHQVISHSRETSSFSLSNKYRESKQLFVSIWIVMEKLWIVDHEIHRGSEQWDKCCSLE